MPNSTLNTEHVVEALDRLLEQYRKKTTWTSVITATVDQIQDLEQAIWDLDAGRNINTAVGVQLDNLGTLVGQERLGFDDDFYRVLLFVKIGVNTSEGDPQKIISTFKLLTQADSVHYMNLGGGNIHLATSNRIPENIRQFAYDNMQRVVASGVRIDHISFYDNAEPFAFAGTNTSYPGFGFSDITGTTGGLFSGLQRDLTPFAFGGDDSSARGLGSLEDSRAGGVLVGIS